MGKIKNLKETQLLKIKTLYLLPRYAIIIERLIYSTAPASDRAISQHEKAKQTSYSIKTDHGSSCHGFFMHLYDLAKMPGFSIFKEVSKWKQQIYQQHICCWKCWGQTQYQIVHGMHRKHTKAPSRQNNIFRKVNASCRCCGKGKRKHL